MQELEEAYLIAKMQGNKEIADFWNKEIMELLLGVLYDSGDTKPTSGTDSGK